MYLLQFVNERIDVIMDAGDHLHLILAEVAVDVLLRKGVRRLREQSVGRDPQGFLLRAEFRESDILL